jgi:hypothetical protein
MITRAVRYSAIGSHAISVSLTAAIVGTSGHPRTVRGRSNGKSRLVTAISKRALRPLVRTQHLPTTSPNSP